jgi:hypothetical protein
MPSAPDIIISPFDGTLDEFKQSADRFFEDHNELRGFNDIKQLIDTLLNDKYLLFQATSDGEVAGLCAARLIDDVVHVDVFVVATDFREIGVGDELFTQVVNNDAFASAKLYESHALPGDRHTKNFFETRAGKTRLLIVSGALPLS